MNSALFLQSETKDPYGDYARMLERNPVFWDEFNRCWVLYSYETCKSALADRNAHIPDINPGNRSALNEYALLILDNLVRLANGQRHEIARDCTLLLFEQMNRVEIGDVLSQLHVFDNKTTQIDWVNDVCKVVPVSLLLKSFEFNEYDQQFILRHIEQLTKLMSPARTAEQVEAINLVAAYVYKVIANHLYKREVFQPIADRLREYIVKEEELLSLCVSNFLGLLIQAYDAGRGLLSNSLIQILRNDVKSSQKIIDKEYMLRSVIEVLRFDPPVQNTRRVAGKDMPMNGNTIHQGDSVVLMIAAANRDPVKFVNPQSYDINRANNNEHLTFGHGPHACVANHFSLMLATETLAHLFANNSKVSCLTKTIEYEPLINVRLPKEIIISLE